MTDNMYLCIYIYMFMFMYVCIYVSMYVCISIFIYVFIKVGSGPRSESVARFCRFKIGPPLLFLGMARSRWLHRCCEVRLGGGVGGGCVK